MPSCQYASLLCQCGLAWLAWLAQTMYSEVKPSGAKPSGADNRKTTIGTDGQTSHGLRMGYWVQRADWCLIRIINQVKMESHCFTWFALHVCLRRLPQFPLWLFRSLLMLLLVLWWYFYRSIRSFIHSFSSLVDYLVGGMFILPIQMNCSFVC